MIGQSNLLRQIDRLFYADKFPHFCIIAGNGSREMVATYICNRRMQYAKYKLPDIKIETVRSMIEDAYTTQDEMFIIIPDADTMSVNAKNALLKVVEEPPKNVYIIMLLSDISNTLDTIKSRAFVFNMERYTLSELREYVESKYDIVAEKAKNLMVVVCETPDEIDMLANTNVLDFYDFVELVVDNISEVEPANAFKSGGKIGLKNDEGYDLKLFWSMFSFICMQHYTETGNKKFLNGILLTSRYIKMLKKLGVNKQQLYDLWVFDIRELWYDD